MDDSVHPGRNRRAKVRLWEQVAAQICQDISRRGLTPGGQLQTELQLAQRFEVSRFTIRNALADLERQGLVRIEHGRGVFVAEPVIPFVLDSRTRFSENLKRLNLAGDRTILETYRDRADAETAQMLKLAVDGEVTVVHSLASVVGRPVGLLRDYYSAVRFGGIDALLKEDPSPTAALRHYGVLDYTRLSTRILSRMPSSAEAEMLNIVRSRPLLETAKVDIDTKGEPIAFGIASFSGDSVQFIVE